MVELVDDARAVSARRGEDKVRAIMGKDRGDVETTDAVLRPGRSIMRREMGDDKLACGVDGVGGEIEGLSLDAVPCGEDGIGAIGTHVVEGEFCEGGDRTNGKVEMRSERTPEQR